MEIMIIIITALITGAITSAIKDNKNKEED